jgi:hypothetical protein
MLHSCPDFPDLQIIQCSQISDLPGHSILSPFQQTRDNNTGLSQTFSADSGEVHPPHASPKINSIEAGSQSSS